MKKHIPNAITAGNLFFGCLSIIATFDENLRLDGENLTWAATCIFIAAVFDFFDGFAARLLKVSSAIGKELDSLADMVSFGVAPGMIFYFLSQEYLVFHQIQFLPLIVVSSYVALLIPVFSAFRLAKFNLDTRQTDSFIGVPTPANALFICAIPFVINGSGPDFAISFFTSVWFIILYPIISSWLLLAEIPLFALKFKTYAWEPNKIRYLFLISCILLITIFKYFGISLGILLYVLLSIVNNFRLQQK